MKVIEVNNLYYSYSQENEDNFYYVLNDLSFSIEKGEYVTFIGHNGSGKSTLMKLLIGLLEANKGSIKIMGEELSEKTLDNIRKKVGIVFQNPDNQFIGATVRDDIAFGLENNCIPRIEMDPLISEYAKKVGMNKYLDKEPSSLSGGQKQRVAIASTLSMKPSILLMDESTAMLDPKGRKEIVELTHKMRQENKDMTIISVTHHMEEAFLSDRVIVLNKGQVVLQGTPKEVFLNEQVLKNIGLDLPFSMKVNSLLKSEGFPVELYSSEKEVISLLCR